MRDRRNFTLVNLYKFKQFIEGKNPAEGAGSIADEESARDRFKGSVASVGGGPSADQALSPVAKEHLDMLEHVRRRSMGTF